MLPGMSEVQAPFIGSEALASGLLNRHQLRSRFRAELPDVYVPKQASLSLSQRTVAAWLWSRRHATVAGAAAAAWHGARWIDNQVPVELIHANARAPRGVITRRDGRRCSCAGRVCVDGVESVGTARSSGHDRRGRTLGRTGREAGAPITP